MLIIIRPSTLPAIQQKLSLYVTDVDVDKAEKVGVGGKENRVKPP